MHLNCRLVSAQWEILFIYLPFKKPNKGAVAKGEKPPEAIAPAFYLLRIFYTIWKTLYIDKNGPLV